MFIVPNCVMNCLFHLFLFLDENALDTLTIVIIAVSSSLGLILIILCTFMAVCCRLRRPVVLNQRPIQPTYQKPSMYWQPKRSAMAIRAGPYSYFKAR